MASQRDLIPCAYGILCLLQWWLLLLVTVFLMWLGWKQVTERGLVMVFPFEIFAGIVAGSAICVRPFIWVGSSRPILIFLLCCWIAYNGYCDYCVRCFHRAWSDVALQLIRLSVNKVKKCLLHKKSHCLLKWIWLVLYPPIFASSILLFPAFDRPSVLVRVMEWNGCQKMSCFGTGAPGQTAYVLLFAVSNCFSFAFFYTRSVNPKCADNLKKIPVLSSGYSSRRSYSSIYWLV